MPLRAELGGQHTGERLERALRGRVRRGAGEGPLRVHAAHEHDAAPGDGEVGDGQAGQQHRADHVRVEDRLQAGLVQVGDRSPLHVPGVVHEHVEPAAAVLDGRLDQPAAIGVDRDVAGHPEAARMDRRRDLGHLVAPPAVDRGHRAALAEVAGDGGADARAATGDDHRHPLDRSHAAPPSCSELSRPAAQRARPRTIAAWWGSSYEAAWWPSRSTTTRPPPCSMAPDHGMIAAGVMARGQHLDGCLPVEEPVHLVLERHGVTAGHADVDLGRARGWNEWSSSQSQAAPRTSAHPGQSSKQMRPVWVTSTPPPAARWPASAASARGGVAMAHALAQLGVALGQHPPAEGVHDEEVPVVTGEGVEGVDRVVADLGRDAVGGEQGAQARRWCPRSRDPRRP